MGKTATAGTLDVHRLAAGAEVYAEDALEVAQTLNWVATNRPATHLSCACGAAAWDGGNEAPPWDATFTGSAEVVASFLVYIDPDVVNLVVGAECYMAAANEGTVTIEVGGDSVVLAFAATDNDAEVVDTLATADTGTGWATVTVTLERTAGASSDNELRHLRIADEALATPPAPTVANGY